MKTNALRALPEGKDVVEVTAFSEDGRNVIVFRDCAPPPLRPALPPEGEDDNPWFGGSVVEITAVAEDGSGEIIVFRGFAPRPPRAVDTTDVIITAVDDGCEVAAAVEWFMNKHNAGEGRCRFETDCRAAKRGEAANCREASCRGVGLDDLWVLTFSRDKGSASAKNIIAAIRAAMGKTTPEVGEPLYCYKNQNDLEVYNGSRGRIVKVALDGKGQGEQGALLTEWQDGGAVQCSGGKIPPWADYAYSLTTHKSQGGEAAHVLVIIPHGCEYLYRKPVFYTACSRARKSLTIMGNTSSIPEILKRGRPPRLTALPFLLGEKKDYVENAPNMTSMGGVDGVD